MKLIHYLFPIHENNVKLRMNSAAERRVENAKSALVTTSWLYAKGYSAPGSRELGDCWTVKNSFDLQNGHLYPLWL